MTTPPPIPDEFRDADRGPRLQKVLAAAGVASRRDCEAMIEEKRVTVNGLLVHGLPARVDPQRDNIAVDGRHVRTAAPTVWVMLFKPRGVVCTNDDPEGRPLAVDLVRHPTGVRLYPVGRLDLDSSGLLLLTNEGELANRLTHPSHGVVKTYEVTLRGKLEDETVARLERGFYLHDRRDGSGSRTAPLRLRVLRRERDRTRVAIELGEGRNRQIRRMMAHIGHPVKKLRRLRVGPLRLTGLRPGQWRDLTPAEVKALREATKRRSDAATKGKKGKVAMSRRARD